MFYRERWRNRWRTTGRFITNSWVDSEMRSIRNTETSTDSKSELLIIIDWLLILLITEWLSCSQTLLSCSGFSHIVHFKEICYWSDFCFKHVFCQSVEPAVSSFFVSFSVNQALQLENRKLQSDLDKLRAEDQNKDQKLQKLMYVCPSVLAVASNIVIEVLAPSDMVVSTFSSRYNLWRLSVSDRNHIFISHVIFLI